VSIHNINCLDYKVRGQGAFDLKIMEFTVLHDYFQIKCNEEIGLYGQTLINIFSIQKKNNKSSIMRYYFSFAGKKKLSK
jgi:hypothetical protein